MDLEIELIPMTTFFTNVRSILPDKWDSLRKACYNKAKYRCEICNGKGDKHPVECHEVWNYDFKKKIQKLERLIALCPSCHEVKHFGLATVRGRKEIAKEHFMKVNNITSKQADKAIKEAFEEWNRKNTIQWKLDISNLEKQ